jgi:beta-glucanase (GH16 family)
MVTYGASNNLIMEEMMNSNRLSLLLCSFLLLVLSACGTSPSNELETEAFTGTYIIQAKHSDLVLDIPGSSKDNGVQVQQYTRNNTAAQQFKLEPVSAGWYTIVNVGSGKALEVYNQYFWLNGTKVQQWDKYTGDNQLWSLEALAGDYYKITNKASGKVLDVAGISYASGAGIQQWDNLDQDNQKWKLISLTPDPVITPPPSPTNAQPTGPSGLWRMTFSDEFSGAALDTNKWNYGFGWGSPYSNSALECTSPSQVRVASGILTITPKNQPLEIETCKRGANDYGRYTSGAIQTKSKFSQQYGYFEARIKGAQGAGFNSAFWGKRADESWPPEIDVVEILGKNKRYYHTVHHKSPVPGSSDKWDSGSNFAAFDPTSGFHTYGVEWSPTFIKWYVDGKLVKTFSDYANYPSVMNMVNGQAFYWILNLHVGMPNWPDMGVPDNSTKWSSTMQVDWVRIWKR